MAKLLIIGAGGVGNVATQKCAAMGVFSSITLASRTLSKCDEIAERCKSRHGVTVKTAKVDADNVPELVKLIKTTESDIVLNLALPYQDLTIMDACLEAGVHYIDTANYEPQDEAKFEYKWQWAYRERFEKAGLTALLGCGFDPGVTNIYCAHMGKHAFDTIRNVDIVDCNGGSHGKAFATNFNPEINIREITANGRYWEDGTWRTTKPLSVSQTFDFPGVGERKMFLLYHEELESLCQNIKGLKRIRFWMTFGETYLKYLDVLQTVGMTRIDPVKVGDVEVVPIKLLKEILPEPSSLAKNYTGKTCIGCVVEGEKDGKFKRQFIYNVCDHAECYTETEGQGISYTTGVPAALTAKLLAEGVWKKPGVHNIETLNPDPFLAEIGQWGLPWQIVDLEHSVA